jgi:hypothetical protein
VHLDEPGPLERLQVLGDLGLAQVEPRRDLSHGPRGLAQQLDDPQAIRLSQRRQESGVHDQKYSPQNIFF